MVFLAVLFSLSIHSYALGMEAGLSSQASQASQAESQPSVRLIQKQDVAHFFQNFPQGRFDVGADFQFLDLCSSTETGTLRDLLQQVKALCKFVGQRYIPEKPLNAIHVKELQDRMKEFVHSRGKAGTLNKKVLFKELRLLYKLLRSNKSIRQARYRKQWRSFFEENRFSQNEEENAIEYLYQGLTESFPSLWSFSKKPNPDLLEIGNELLRAKETHFQQLTRPIPISNSVSKRLGRPSLSIRVLPLAVPQSVQAPVQAEESPTGTNSSQGDPESGNPLLPLRQLADLAGDRTTADFTADETAREISLANLSPILPVVDRPLRGSPIELLLNPLKEDQVQEDRVQEVRDMLERNESPHFEDLLKYRLYGQLSDTDRETLKDVLENVTGIQSSLEVLGAYHSVYGCFPSEDLSDEQDENLVKELYEALQAPGESLPLRVALLAKTYANCFKNCKSLTSCQEDRLAAQLFEIFLHIPPGEEKQTLLAQAYSDESVNRVSSHVLDFLPQSKASLKQLNSALERFQGPLPVKSYSRQMIEKRLRVLPSPESEDSTLLSSMITAYLTDLAPGNSLSKGQKMDLGFELFRIANLPYGDSEVLMGLIGKAYCKSLGLSEEACAQLISTGIREREPHEQKWIEMRRIISDANSL